MILITGASGLLGANLVLEARKQNKEITAFYHSHKLVYPGVQSICVDLKNKQSVQEIIKNLRPDWIIHCAALADVDFCEKYPAQAHLMNAGVTRSLAEAAKQIDAGFVYISTDSIFAGERGHYTEEHIPTPMNEYAKSKYSGELIAQQFVKESLIIRTNFYGWNMQPKQSLAEWFIGQLVSGQAITGFHDVFFTPILVHDLCNIILELIDRKITGILNVAGSQTCNKYEFAVQLARVFNLPVELIAKTSIRNAHLSAFRPRNTSLSCRKVRQVLNKEMPDLMSGLLDFYNQRLTGLQSKIKEMRGDLHYANNQNWREGNWNQSANLFHC